MFQTGEVVRQQIEAMKSDVFELGLFRIGGASDELDAQMLPRASPVSLVRFYLNREMH
jgi:hypothetical protein